MKKLIILNSALFLLFTSCSLKKFTVNDGITVKMPSNVKTMTREERPQKIESFKIADQTYTVNGIRVALSKITDPNIHRFSIEDRKTALVYDYKKLFKIESADIVTYNNNKFIVMNYHDSITGENDDVYTFFSNPENKGATALGYIRYNKATQQKEAEKLLKTILTNLKTD